jgi:hypothetical protein
MTQKYQLNKIRGYDRHKSRACVDLFLKVTLSSILTTIINRDAIFDYVIFVWSLGFIYHCLVHSFIAEKSKNSVLAYGWGITEIVPSTLWETGISTYMQVGRNKSTSGFSMLNYVVGTVIQFPLLATICSIFVWF